MDKKLPLNNMPSQAEIEKAIKKVKRLEKKMLEDEIDQKELNSLLYLYSMAIEYYEFHHDPLFLEYSKKIPLCVNRPYIKRLLRENNDNMKSSIPKRKQSIGETQATSMVQAHIIFMKKMEERAASSIMRQEENFQKQRTLRKKHTKLNAITELTLPNSIPFTQSQSVIEEEKLDYSQLLLERTQKELSEISQKHANEIGKITEAFLTKKIKEEEKITKSFAKEIEELQTQMSESPATKKIMQKMKDNMEKSIKESYAKLTENKSLAIKEVNAKFDQKRAETMKAYQSSLKQDIIGKQQINMLKLGCEAIERQLSPMMKINKSERGSSSKYEFMSPPMLSHSKTFEFKDVNLLMKKEEIE